MSESNIPRDQDPTQSQGLAIDAEANTEFLSALIENADPRPTADEFLGMLAAQGDGDLISRDRPVSARSILEGVKVELSGHQAPEGNRFITSAAGIGSYFDTHKGEMAVDTTPEVSADGTHVTLRNRAQLRGFLMAHEKRGFDDLSTTEVAARVQAMIDEVNDLETTGEQALRVAGEQNLFDLPPEISMTVANILLDERHKSLDGKVEDFIDTNETVEENDDTVEGEADLETLRKFADEVRGEREPSHDAQSVGEIMADREARVAEGEDVLRMAHEAVAADAISDDPSLVAELVAAERIIASQIADLQKGTNLQSIEGSFTDAEQPTDIEAGSEDQAEKDSNSEFMSYEDLVSKHTIDIIHGQAEIDGADPSMVAELSREVRHIERLYVQSRTENNLNDIGKDVHTAAAELIQRSDSLSEVVRMSERLMHEYSDFVHAARSLQSAANYGDSDGLVRWAGQFRQASDALGLSGSMGTPPSIYLLGGEAFDGTRDQISHLQDIVREANDRVSQERDADRNVGMAETEAELVKIFEDGGRTLEGMRAQIADMYPNHVATHRQIQNIEEVASHLRTVGSIVHLETTGGYHDQDGATAFTRLRNDTTVLIEQMRRGGANAIDGAQLGQLAHQAEQIMGIIDSVRRFSARTQAVAQAQLG